MLNMKRIVGLSGIAVALAGALAACGTGNSVVPQAPVAGTVGGGCYASPYSTGYNNGYAGYGGYGGYGGGGSYGVNGGCQAGYIMSGTMCCPSGYNTGYGYNNGYNTGYSNGGYGGNCPYPTVYYPNYGCR
jgi:hypothetical protein